MRFVFYDNTELIDPSEIELSEKLKTFHNENHYFMFVYNDNIPEACINVLAGDGDGLFYVNFLPNTEEPEKFFDNDSINFQQLIEITYNFSCDRLELPYLYKSKPSYEGSKSNSSCFWSNLLTSFVITMFIIIVLLGLTIE